jgi:putative membrane protein
VSTQPPEAGEQPDAYEPDIRFLLANERTFLAWLRTALALLAGGVAVLELATSVDARVLIGVVLLAVGAACAMLGLHRFRVHDRAIRHRRETPSAGRSPETLTVAFVAISVLVAAAYIASDAI